MKHNKHAMNLAKRISSFSDHHAHKVGSVIVRKNRVIGVGCNKTKTHTKSFHSHKSTHAEFSAILSVGDVDYGKCEIYVYREKKNGIMGNSKPCEWCQKMLISLGIRKVFYSHEEGIKSQILF